MEGICWLYVAYMLAISKVYQRQVMSRSKILYSMANAKHKSYATSEWRWKRHLSVTAASVGSADWKDTNITDPESGRPLQLMGHSFRVLAVDGVLSHRSFRPTVTERRRLQRLLMPVVRFLRDAFGFRSVKIPRSTYDRLLPKGRKNSVALPPLSSAEFPNSAASLNGSLQLPLSQSDKMLPTT